MRSIRGERGGVASRARGLQVALLFLLLASSLASAQKMYWTDGSGGRIRRADLNGTGVEDLVLTVWPAGLDLDVAGRKMYWGEGTNPGRIHRANLDGSAVEDVVTQGVRSPYGVALDLAGDRIYWTSGALDSVGMARLDGSGVVTLWTVNAFPIAVDTLSRQVYWAQVAYQGVMRADLDLTNELLVHGTGWSLGLALDPCGRKIYWTDWNEIRRADLDGGGTETFDVLPSYPSALALDVVNGKLYWADSSAGEIYRANLDCSAPELLVTGAGACGDLALDLPWGRCAGVCGDCDGDGLGPNILDVFRAAWMGLGPVPPPPAPICCCDVNSSGRVDILDALLIAQQSVGLPVTLTCL